MSHELKKTLVFVAVAVLLMGAALVNIPDRRKDEAFSDVGQKFFPDFVDPDACTSLEVVDVDNDTAVVTPFKVQFKDGKWTIPSHNDYPADGKDRLAKTATGVMGLNKDTLRSDRVEDQEALGVIDPLDPKASVKGRGERVTLKDASDKVLADFILGKEVKGRSDQRYVRVPGQKRTYAVNVKADISARFADWIETNLLKLDTGKVRTIAFDSTKVDTAGSRPQLVPGEVVTIRRKGSSEPWTIDGKPIPEGKELDTEKLFSLTSALGDVKIVDIQRKPDGLTRDLIVTGDLKAMTSREAYVSLLRRGFFPDPQREGRVYSSQGSLVISTDEGAVYTLRFGEAAIAGGEFTPEPAKKDQAKAEPNKPGGVESRYLMVTIAFDPKLLPPLPDPDAGRPLTIPDDVFKRNPGEPQYEAEQKAAKEKADRRKAEEDKRIADAEAKVKELSDRFAGWYYLTPDSAYKSLALDRTSLIRDKQAKPATGGPPGGGFPGGFPGGAGFPGGLGGPANPHSDN